MAKKVAEFEDVDQRKKERNLEFQRNIITGYIIRKLHKEEGSYGYLIQLLEPYLEKNERRLFGLPF